MSKAIQIVTHSANLIALCDDGTMWSLNDHRKSWNKLPDIPSPNPMHIQILNKEFGAVGSIVDFAYKGGRRAKGVLVKPIDHRIVIKLHDEYRGANVYWEPGELKIFDSKVVYNLNFKNRLDRV
jgi:hypothetical protein